MNFSLVLRAFVSSCLILCLSCGPSLRGASASGGATQGGFVTPPGLALTMACTPTGAELCFNAIDDNCNGVIDEGCGLKTGVLQFTIAWSESAVDVDLSLTDPSGARVSQETRGQSPARGFQLDHDCPRDNCNGQNIENIVFEGLDPPPGHYVVEVRLTDLHGAKTPVHVTYGARVGAKTDSQDLMLGPPNEEKRVFAYDL